jgi:V-type H+-transporting ATPase subunit a
VVDLAQEMQTEPSKTARLGFISGLVPKLKVTSFERILFRATRGNMFLKQVPIEQPVDDPATGEKVLYLPLSVYEEMEII